MKEERSQAEKPVETPLMKQYYEMKQKFPDAVLLFRVGDFYETFSDDAIRASQILGITLTRRANGSSSYVELAGFPHHAVETYLPKLVKAGLRVAICEQLENPKLTKKLVKRGITELVTPGLSYNEKLLENKINNYLAAVFLNQHENGVAFLDISTGEFYVAQGSLESVDKLMQTYKPAEVILEKGQRKNFVATFGDRYYINTFEDWVFTKQFAMEKLLQQFHTKSLKGFGIQDLDAGIIAAGAVMHYLAETCHDQNAHICKVSKIVEENYVSLDQFTIRNLELLDCNQAQGAALIDILDHTQSPMGARMLRRWLLMPLKSRVLIDARLDIVALFIENEEVASEMKRLLKQIGDLERLISKLAMGRIVPRELVQLRRSLEATKTLCELSQSLSHPALDEILEAFNLCPSALQWLQEQISEEAPVSINKGQVFKPHVSAELDELRLMAYSGKDYLLNLQKREAEATGIGNLKIGYNNVFGYYLEVSNSHKLKVPNTWTRKQTLTNGERYITEELKVYEQKILSAEDRILELETNLYNELLARLSEYIEPLQINAQKLAKIDVLLGFSEVSVLNHYVRPQVTEGFDLRIHQGRHPVIETQLPIGEAYVANDIYLDTETQQICIITGPNMSGKSALLRQTALIVLMAQSGCFVPAESAEIGWVDRVFTRVGASDNLSSGESTFMVEMNETASILNNISNRCLVLLDEIGRGTSTYDGISIAWAITEYLHDHPQFRPKVLFATHYHELNEMAEKYPRIQNYHVSVKEVGKQVLFLRKLQPGGSAHSFGIHVARLAGVPDSVIGRAEDLLSWLESSHTENPLASSKAVTATKSSPDYQLSFMQLDDPLLEEIRDDILSLDIDTLTPVEALMKLHGIQTLLDKNRK